MHKSRVELSRNKKVHAAFYFALVSVYLCFRKMFTWGFGYTVYFINGKPNVGQLVMIKFSYASHSSKGEV